MVIIIIDVFNLLKNAKPNSVLFTHVHPSSTLFSSSDLEFMFNYKSIKAYTLECANGDNIKEILKIRF